MLVTGSLAHATSAQLPPLAADAAWGHAAGAVQGVGPGRRAGMPRSTDDVANRPAAHAEDRALMERVAAHDEPAQRELAKRLLPIARKVTRALLRDAVESDDATQLSLIEILRSAKSYRGETAVERWAQRIIVRTTLRHIRDQRRFYKVVDAEAEVGDVRATPVSRRASEELPRPPEAYLAEISEVQREAVLLHHALGYTVPEIAEITGVTQNTAKARLLYGRRALRKLVRRDLNIGKGQDS